MVRSFFWQSTYVAYFDSSSWRCLVDRACGDIKWIDTPRDGAGRLVEHANRQGCYRQGCCLQLDSGRSLDPIIHDFVILE